MGAFRSWLGDSKRMSAFDDGSEAYLRRGGANTISASDETDAIQRVRIAFNMIEKLRMRDVLTFTKN